MRSAIENCARKYSITLTPPNGAHDFGIEYAQSSGTDSDQGRLWTESDSPAGYERLCRSIKQKSKFDRESGLWFKTKSEASFRSYRITKKIQTEELVKRNIEYARNVLGAK
jgi:hypothetical protein